MKILIIDGGARYQGTCPGIDSKTKEIVKKLKSYKRQGVAIDSVDLAVKGDGKIIQPCMGCVGTAGGYHCHWKCDCYGPQSANKDLWDFMHEKDVYKKLERADAIMILTPINWYSSTTQVKAFFDRLVCANETLTVEEARKLFGKDGTKNPAFTRQAAIDRVSKDKLKNHLEGKVAAFWVYGDAGANDYENKKLPASMEGRKDEGYINKPKEAVMEYVWQLRYSGIYVPDELIKGDHFAEGKAYPIGDDEMRNSKVFENSAMVLLLKLIDETRTKMK